MPFKSEKQRRYLWLKHPDIAKRWADTYPTKKDLPMYADDTKANEKQSMAAQILTRVLPNHLRMFATSGATRVYDANIKKSDSKQEYVKLPKKHGPTFAGESDAQAEGLPEGDGVNNNNAMSPEKQDQVTASALFKKLAVVLSPVLMQEIEDEQAQQQAREAQRMPTNIGVKHTPPAVNSIMPPMGLAQTPPNPGQTQQAQPAQPQQPQQPANGQLASVGGGGSPNSNPINAFGGLSSTGDINGNAALGTQNMAGGEKMAAGALDFLRPPRPPKEPLTIEKSVGRGLINLWRSGQKPTPAPTAPPAPAAAPAYKHWLDKFELAKAAAGNDALAWLTSIDNCDTTADDDLDYVERVKSAAPVKKAGLSTGELIQQSWPIAAGGIGGSLVGSYGPLAVGMRPNTMLGLGGTSLGVALGGLYNMHRLRNRSKKEKKAGLLDFLSAPKLEKLETSGALPQDDKMYDWPRGQAFGAPYATAGGIPKGYKYLGTDHDGNSVLQGPDGKPVSMFHETGDLSRPTALVLSKLAASSPAWQRNPFTQAQTAMRSQPTEQATRAYLQQWAAKHKTPDYIRDSWEDLEDDLPFQNGVVPEHDELHTNLGNRLRDPKQHQVAATELLKYLQLAPSAVSAKQASGSRAKRQNSFCSRMCGMKAHETGADTKKDPESRINKALRKWNCKCANCAGQPFEVIKSANLERMLTSALVAAGGGLALGSYPGWQLQQASAKAGNPDYVNSFVGRIPIAAAGALSGGLYNYLREQQDEDTKKKLIVPAAH